MRVLELFAGIGGFAACAPSAKITAVDIDRDAQAVYRANFTHPVVTRELASVSNAWLGEFDASLWWMSPPCTPFTRRGRKRDLEDSRNRAFLRLIDAVVSLRPQTLMIENVEGFECSATMQHLCDRWLQVGYEVDWRRLCPGDLGWPCRRPRIYTVARLGRQVTWPEPPRLDAPLAAIIAPQGVGNDLDQLLVPEEVSKPYNGALRGVDPGDPEAIASTFTRSYGTSPIASGSYVTTSSGLRHFSPDEVAALLGFPANWKWPAGLTRRRRWRLLGNSLALPVVRYLVDAFCPALGNTHSTARDRSG